MLRSDSFLRPPCRPSAASSLCADCPIRPGDSSRAANLRVRHTYASIGARSPFPMRIRIRNGMRQTRRGVARAHSVRVGREAVSLSKKEMPKREEVFRCGAGDTEGMHFPIGGSVAESDSLVMAAVVFAIVYAARHFGRHGGGHREDSAVEILEKRYARGEITKEQLEEMIAQSELSGSRMDTLSCFSRASCGWFPASGRRAASRTSTGIFGGKPARPLQAPAALQGESVSSPTSGCRPAGPFSSPR